jgi:integrase
MRSNKKGATQMSGKITKRVRRGKVVWTEIINLPAEPVTGKRRQKRISAPTKKEVETEQARLLSGIAAGGYAEADAKKITVDKYLGEWLLHVAPTLRPASRGRYAEVIKLHIGPVLGRVLLAKLTPLDVQRLYADRLAGGLSPTTVSLIHNMLHKALKQAVRWGLLTRNVTEMVEPPSRARSQYTVWTGEQVRTFLAAADRDEYAALWRLAVYTGMRRGEMLGLQWADVDFERAVLSVKRTYSRGTDDKFELGQTKTASGRRQITLPSNLVGTLRAHRIKQLEDRLQMGEDYQDKGFVFANAIGEPVHPNTLAGHFSALIAAVELPRIRIHDLRHGHATLLMEDGVHPKVVSERLGHSNIKMTIDLYSHVTPTMQRQVSDRLEKLIEGGA